MMMIAEQTRIWGVLLQDAFGGLSTPFPLAPSLSMKLAGSLAYGRCSYYFSYQLAGGALG